MIASPHDSHTAAPESVMLQRARVPFLTWCLSLGAIVSALFALTQATPSGAQGCRLADALGRTSRTSPSSERKNSACGVAGVNPADRAAGTALRRGRESGEQALDPRPADGIPQDIDQHMRLKCDMLVLAFRTDTT